MTKRVAGVFLIGVTLLAAACSSPASIPLRSPEVSQSQSSYSNATIGVDASDFQVLITARGPAWIQVTSGLWNPYFSGLLQPGETKMAASENGKVSVLFKSAQVKVTVQIGGRTVPNWIYAPPRAPFTLNFASTNRPPGVLIGFGGMHQ
jgi:hypothetical protein